MTAVAVLLLLMMANSKRIPKKTQVKNRQRSGNLQTGYPRQGQNHKKQGNELDQKPGA